MGLSNNDNNANIAFISMPWMSPSMPSIQLATLASVLKRVNIQSDIYELYVDYMATIGPDFYNLICTYGGGFIEEWLFARAYYRAEEKNKLESFLKYRPRLNLKSLEIENEAINILADATEDFLEKMASDQPWQEYRIIGFSLTISQTASSMAMARLLKKSNPSLKIIAGGSACAGQMGKALLKICPYFDVVVTTEAEIHLPELIHRLLNDESPEGIKGVIWRESDNVKGIPGDKPVPAIRMVEELNYDSYFRRLDKYGLTERMEVWLPFESSRGCWWGEKHQCTFCGLHEIMEYRGRNSLTVIKQLESFSEMYDIKRFFAVDLIMPQDYYTTFLPEIIKGGYRWNLFYEIKANIQKENVRLLAEAGVRWIQPGLESLDDSILGLMSKGVSSLKNIEVLKWCQEFGISVTWNIITGIPGEDPNVYEKMNSLVKKLHHLSPPSGASPFQLHRFSPYFNEPKKYGLVLKGAFPLYKHIFPIAKEDLDDLVYLYHYDLEEKIVSYDYTIPLVDSISEWKLNYKNGARLTTCVHDNGCMTIEDTRGQKVHIEYFNHAETLLFLSLDAAVFEKICIEDFEKNHPEYFNSINGIVGIEKLFSTWENNDWVLREKGKILSLTVTIRYTDQKLLNSSEKEHAPVAYLGV